MSDAEAACRVLRRSITELCTADHRGDPAILDRWLGNKTAEIVRGWIAACGHTVLVAERASEVIGVAGVTDAGQITLNYVGPNARFGGVSTAMLAKMEHLLREVGVQRSQLSSTATARGFYQRRGYVDVGRSVVFDGVIDYHMAKQLQGKP